jgi:hypothetical protein
LKSHNAQSISVPWEYGDMAVREGHLLERLPPRAPSSKTRLRRPSLTRAGILIAAAVLAAAILAASCAAPLTIGASADPLGLLDPGTLAYARLSGKAARELATAILPAARAKSLSPLLDRTRVVAIGLASLPGPGAADAASSRPSATKAPAFQAVLVGDYPFRAASLFLGANAGWKREKSAFSNAGLGLRAAIPGPSLVLASSGPIEGLLTAAKRPGPSPIPEKLAALASAELVIWVPEPFAGLASAFLGEAMDVPARGLLIAASPMADSANASIADAGGYDATVVFLMADANAVRVYKGALRLAWYGISRMLSGDGGAAASAQFIAEGELYMARGIRISPEKLGAALGKRLSLREGGE